MSQLSEQQRMKGVMLSQETVALFQETIDDLTYAMVTIAFPADPLERETTILAFVEMQARRNVLVNLIAEARTAYEAIAAATFQQPGTPAATPSSTF